MFGAVSDVLSIGLPTGGVSALIGALLRLQWRAINDQRRNEHDLRAEFATERDRLRRECEQERRDDRAEIADLRSRVDEMQRRLDGRA